MIGPGVPVRVSPAALRRFLPDDLVGAVEPKRGVVVESADLPNPLRYAYHVRQDDPMVKVDFGGGQRVWILECALEVIR